MARKKAHVLFVVRGIIFVDSGNENWCSGGIRPVVCVLGLGIGGRFVLVMEIVRLRMGH